ncbi:MAG: RNA methyltransferase [Phycisphaerae bacterium]|nr:RNA methyltransferase [Phycisphaerae bacterium]
MTPRPLNLIPIDRANDPRVADYLNIRDAQLAGELSPAGPRYMAEGELVVETMLRAARPAESLFLLPTRLETMGEVLARHLPAGTPVYLASQGVMDAIVGIHLHRGVLALGRRWPLPPLPDILRDATSALVLEDLTNHDNMGGLFRAAAALGGPRPAIILSPRSCDPLYRKSLRVSIGHALQVPYTIASDWPEAIDAINDAGFTTIAMTPSGSIDLTELAKSPERPPRPAIVLGTEGRGLSDDAMSRCTLRARIAMNDGVDSLNVVVAGAIALHALM